MRPHHRTVAPGMALRRQQRRQRYGLRRRKGQVESRTALVPAVPDPPQPDLRPRHMTLQQPLERPRRHPRARLQTQRLRPTPVPRARLAVLFPLRAKRSRVALRPDVIPRRRAGNTSRWPTTRSDCGSSLPSKRTITGRAERRAGRISPSRAKIRVRAAPPPSVTRGSAAGKGLRSGQEDEDADLTLGTFCAAARRRARVLLRNRPVILWRYSGTRSAASTRTARFSPGRRTSLSMCRGGAGWCSGDA